MNINDYVWFFASSALVNYETNQQEQLKAKHNIDSKIPLPKVGQLIKRPMWEAFRVMPGCAGADSFCHGGAFYGSLSELVAEGYPEAQVTIKVPGYAAYLATMRVAYKNLVTVLPVNSKTHVDLSPELIYIGGLLDNGN